MSENALTRVFSRIAEEMTFMFVESMEGPPPPTEPPYLCVSMQFMGPFSGVLSLYAPGGLCRLVAMNVLGVDNPEEMGEHFKPCDTMCELLNVTCGNLLPELAGREPVFNLTPPRASEIDASEWESITRDPEAVGFLMDDYPVYLKLVRS
ncbi:MAG TPA: chemotaxis protein CheX [Candidatus Hydrogenedentes bacterium]|nr:chemotaxis protein CheX [Candidatus Hydrogenedentota bacterium]HOK89202.1 chemotaxis protein CheX [Candidatus Hydrogenedentota bacterium]HPO31391.1 chemotaxis protein CheX [Candidatus Hydrogenedentota bacterium]